jgi:hypothetical protein
VLLDAGELPSEALKKPKKVAIPKQTKKERGEVPYASKFADVLVNIQRELAIVENSDYPSLFDALEEKRYFDWKIVDLNDGAPNTGFRKRPEKSATGNFERTPVSAPSS